MSDTRSQAIADHVHARGEVRIDDLAGTFGVSRMTIHRHVEKLVRQGVLRKLHGAVTAQPSSVYESVYAYREGSGIATKQALARAALSELQPGEAVAMDDSTTVTMLAPLLAQVTPQTVVTNSLALMQRLAGQDDIALIGTGGDYHPTYHAFIGPGCENTLAGLRVNLAVCSASAIHDGAALVQDAQVTRAKAAMLASAQRRVLMVASGKFGRMALHKLADLTDFDAVYTDDHLSPEVADPLRAKGVPLRLVAL